ncbi:MAG TPA: NADH-quinone oxidoreductase subunit NuoE [Candidatus Cloacimonadota bacterium]|nr:NADH-quinone oxidoreductase subunit NuoE [Candidatus Cloacimonadota bacterium]HQL14352.1 NADH-quinone oxidoreductase subunit NuoE [Candidatus Cloacimonadota bacterium]
MQNTKPELDALLNRYKGQKGALIPLLQEIQKMRGYLTQDILKYVSEKTGIPCAEIFGVATFYAMFRLKPQGKYIIRVCKGTACHVSGANSIADAVREHLKLTEVEDTTADGLFTVMEVACLGCCSLSPVIMIGEQTYGKLTPEKIPGILNKYKHQGEQNE